MVLSVIMMDFDAIMRGLGVSVGKSENVESWGRGERAKEV